MYIIGVHDMTRLAKSEYDFTILANPFFIIQSDIVAKGSMEKYLTGCQHDIDHPRIDFRKFFCQVLAQQPISHANLRSNLGD